MKLSTHKRSEVEIRVAQELKNRQEFEYRTNLALQSLKNDFLEIQKKFSLHLGQTGSTITKLMIDMENFMENIQKLNTRMYENVTRAESKSKSSSELAEKIKTEMEIVYQSCDNVLKEVDKLRKEIAISKSEMGVSHNFISSAIAHQKQFFLNEIERLKKELAPKPLEEDFLRKEVQSLFEAFKVDHKSLKEDLERFKQCAAYDQKKFEDLYNQINRLKERKV